MKRKKVGWKYRQMMEQKALRRPRLGRRKIGRNFRRIDKPNFDGDGDGFITNPATGRDDLPAPSSAMGKRPRRTRARLGEFSPTEPKKRERRTRFEEMFPGAGGSGRKPPRKPKPATPPDPERFPDEIVTSDMWRYRRDKGAVRVGKQFVVSDRAKAIKPVPDGINVPRRYWNGLPLSVQEQIEDMFNGQKEQNSAFYREMREYSPRDWKTMIDREFLMRSRRRAENLAKNRNDPNYSALDDFYADIDQPAEDDDIAALGRMIDETMDSVSSGREFGLSEYFKTRMAMTRNSRRANRRNQNTGHEFASRLAEEEIYALADSIIPRVAILEQKAKERLGLGPDENLPPDLMLRIIKSTLPEEFPGMGASDDASAAIDYVAELFGYPGFWQTNIDDYDPSTIEAILSGDIRRLFNDNFSWDERSDYAYLPNFEDDFDGSEPPAWITDLAVISDPSSEIPLSPDDPDWRPYVEEIELEDDED